jgi:hypothetical protein
MISKVFSDSRSNIDNEIGEVDMRNGRIPKLSHLNTGNRKILIKIIDNTKLGNSPWLLARSVLAHGAQILTMRCGSQSVKSKAWKESETHFSQTQ